MINPIWLEGTYVVKNEGIDYEAADDDYVARDTVIVTDRYRNFAAQHPNQTTYFQPVLDVLNYKPTELENVPNVLMVEGKYDYYTLKHFQLIVSSSASNLNIIPGGGAGTLDDVIRLYVGWGREFIALLDGDSAGTSEKNRYKDLFGLIVDNRIFTLADIDGKWNKKDLEYVLPESDRIAIQQTVYPSAKKFQKTHFNRAVQELYLTGTRLTLSPEGISNAERILNFCERNIAGDMNRDN